MVLPWLGLPDVALAGRQVRDLLSPVSFDYNGLKVRTNKQLGSWVQGLEPNVVTSPTELHNVRRR